MSLYSALSEAEAGKRLDLDVSGPALVDEIWWISDWKVMGVNEFR